MMLEPITRVSRIRTMRKYQAPEAHAVIHVLQMRNFMHGDIIQYMRWREYQAPGIAETAVGGA